MYRGCNASCRKPNLGYMIPEDLYARQVHIPSAPQEHPPCMYPPSPPVAPHC